MGYPKYFENLIDAFRRLPGVGYKSAERMAHSILSLKKENIDAFIEALNNVTKLKKCSICNNISDKDICQICEDDNRDKRTICVVQNIKDLYAIEKSGTYNGVYHVLDGIISASKKTLPENLNIDTLIARTKKAKEIIIATNPTIDGETTALFIVNLLSSEKIKITRLAYGLPMGGNLEYSDELTITKSFENRKTI
jgi:recombination protein RecR